MSERLKALNEAKGPYEFWGNKQPKCPHCGEDFDISENEAWRLYDEDDRHEVDCPHCELPFRVSSSAVWTFSTDEQDDE